MIVTFYSFKGGVGRSFTLVDVAMRLAGLGYSVLVWDLDLEAPGLQRIPDLQPLEENLKQGTLDILLQFQESSELPADLSPFLVEYTLPAGLRGNNGKLRFLLPAQLDNSYEKKFGEIDWLRLFAPESGAGPAFFSGLARRLEEKEGFEIILIDSRTGITDLGAICTFYLPDLVTIVFNFNEQNLTGIERAHSAITKTLARQAVDGNSFIPVFLVANMVPKDPKPLVDAKLERLTQKGLRPHCLFSLHTDLLLTDKLPALDPKHPANQEFAKLVEGIESRYKTWRVAREQEEQSTRSIRSIAEELGVERFKKREIFERTKTFEERVAELFELLGYHAVVYYTQGDQRFDIRLERQAATLPEYLLVECTNTLQAVPQNVVTNFASRVMRAKNADYKDYKAVVVAREQFANNAHDAAVKNFVRLLTYDQLLRSLVDLGPNVERIIRDFQGTALERLYVEQDLLFHSDLARDPIIPRPVVEGVQSWLEREDSSFLTLLGDFGAGKTSFVKRFACDLAVKSKEGGSNRIPIVLDLREARSTTMRLENILTGYFQTLGMTVNANALLHLNRQGYLVLIFDGFDEVVGYSDPERFLGILQEITRAAEGKAKVILTCRTHYFRDEPDAVRTLKNSPDTKSTAGATRLYEEVRERPGFELAYMKEFNQAQIDLYLQKALQPPADWKDFREQIRRTYNLENLAQRPFLLEIIVRSLPRATTGGKGQPVTIADLYEIYCNEWFEKTDAHLSLTRDRKIQLVEYLARLIWESADAKVHHSTLAAKAVEFYADKTLTLLDKERIDYEVRTALFLNRDAGGHYTFIHRSFLEFFMARSLRNTLISYDTSALDTRRITREVTFFLEFYPEAQRLPHFCKSVLSGPYRRRVSENALVLLYFHACAQLGPLLGPETPRNSGIREAFQGVRPKALNLEDADLSAANLAGIDLSHAAMKGANLRRAAMEDAVMDHADLSYASLESAILRRTSLKGANLSGANLNHVDARHANLVNARMQGADLTFGCFADAALEGAASDGAITKGAGFLRASLDGRLAISADNTVGRKLPAHLALVVNAGHSASVNIVAWSPDGRVLASASDDNTVKIWDASSAQLLHTLESHKNSVLSVAWHPDGSRLASASSDKTVKIWDAFSARLLHTLDGHTSSVWSVAWHPDGSRLASASSDKTVKIWESDAARLLHSLDGHKHAVLSVAWHPDGSRLASSDNTIKIWDISSVLLLHTLDGHNSAVWSVAWHPDGSRLASASSDITIKLWDTDAGRLLHTLEGHKNAVMSVAWHPDGSRLASASDDKSVKIWDTSAARLLYTFENHASSTLSVAWHPDGSRLASASSDRTVKIWDTSAARLVHTLEGHKNAGLSVAWHPDGSRLASASDDNSVKIWDTSAARLLYTLEGHKNYVCSVAWHPDGSRLASASSDNTIKIWDADAHLLHTLEGHPNYVRSVAWHPDGSRLASASDDNTIKIWNASTARLLHTLEGHKNSVLSVAWHPDGICLASGSADHTVKIWDASTARLLHTLEGDHSYVWSVAWHPDGSRLASASDDKTVEIWNIDATRLLHTLKGHTNSVLSVAWHPDGSRLASASDDNTIRIWDAESARLLHTLDSHKNYVRSVAWHPDGSRLASASDDNTIKVWAPADPNEPLRSTLIGFYGSGGVAISPDGYVAGDPKALERINLVDGWAVYGLEDFPERVSQDRVTEYLQGPASARPSSDPKGARKRPPQKS